ncbi:hypothetical protein Mapa_002315 [Marchantia paleacea]|nr:hypothetical protein Mapa_002315 [Marchantia paleacea]
MPPIFIRGYSTCHSQIGVNSLSHGRTEMSLLALFLSQVRYVPMPAVCSRSPVRGFPKEVRNFQTLRFGFLPQGIDRIIAAVGMSTLDSTVYI